MYGRGLPPIFVGFLTKPSITSQPPSNIFICGDKRITQAYIQYFFELNSKWNIIFGKIKISICFVPYYNRISRLIKWKIGTLSCYTYFIVWTFANSTYFVQEFQKGVYSQCKTLCTIFFPSRLEDIHITREHAYYVVRYLQ